MPAKTPPDALKHLYQIAAACIAIDNGIYSVKLLFDKELDADTIKALDNIASLNASAGTAIRQLAERLGGSE